MNDNALRNGSFPAAEDRRHAGDPTFLQRKFYEDATRSFYGATGDVAVADVWGNPIVLQIPPPEAFTVPGDETIRFHYARVVSAGPDGELETPRDRLAGMASDGSTARRGDDLVLFLNRADIHESE